MSDFWAKRLGAATAPAAAPAPAPATNAGSPWWSVPTPAATPPASQATPDNGYGSGIPSVDEQQAFSNLIHQENYTTTKAQSARDGERCPNCDGPNYLHIGGLKTRAKRCFDCGYNPMFEQSMAGVSGTGQNIPVKTARVQTLSQNNFNPRQVIGHA